MPKEKGSTQESTQTIKQKLIEARYRLSTTHVPKTGRMSIGGRSYKYFELADIQPVLIKICRELQLSLHFEFLDERSELWIENAEDDEKREVIAIHHKNLLITQTDPQKHLQSIGSKTTYLTRYLLIIAFHISENDSTELLAAKATEEAAQENNKKQKENKIKKEKRDAVFNSIKAILNNRSIDPEDQREFLMKRFEEDWKFQRFDKILEMLEKEENESKEVVIKEQKNGT